MLLVHVPPLVASLKLVVSPTHTDGVPIIDGPVPGDTVIYAFAVSSQPVAYASYVVVTVGVTTIVAPDPIAVLVEVLIHIMVEPEYGIGL